MYDNNDPRDKHNSTKPYFGSVPKRTNPGTFRRKKTTLIFFKPLYFLVYYAMNISSHLPILLINLEKMVGEEKQKGEIILNKTSCFLINAKTSLSLIQPPKCYKTRMHITLF